MILHYPLLLWLLVPLLILVFAAAWRGRVRSSVLLVRCMMLVVIVTALADPLRPGTTPPSPLVVLVDVSASIEPSRRAAAWGTAQAIAQQHGERQTVLAAFGQGVEISDDGQMPAVDAAASDIPAALRFAGDLLGGSSGDLAGRHVILISDGMSTSPGADLAAAELRQNGAIVDVLPLAADDRLDARLTEIGIPASLREGQSYRGEVVIVASAPTAATLRFAEDDQPASEQELALKAGRNVIPFSGIGGRSGLHRLRAELMIADAHQENNLLERAVEIGPSPRVLVIEREPDSAAGLRDLLEAGGVQSEARRPADLPNQLSDLERFDSIVLQDVPATALTLDQQATLREYVRALGHGLLALGGANSFGLGKYQGTPLEDVLPVDMRPPPRRERQIVALLLIIDHSASMYGRDPATSKLEMAKSGAIAATQALVPNDRLGVLVFDSATEWVVPFTSIGEGRSLSEIQDNIARIQFGGGTDIFRALAEGLPVLAAQGGAGEIGAKHAVLLTDGRSYADDPDYQLLVQNAREQGVTLSTIAIGQDADLDLLKRLADQGAGRYYYAAQPEDLPRLTLQETEIARDDPKIEGDIQPQVERAHPTLRGFVPRRLPHLAGYIATTPKPTADVILQSPEGDALLAAWQYGLGRAIAWTSDSGERWAEPWQSWAESPTFWTQVLGYTFPDPASGRLQTRIEPDGDALKIVAEATSQSGAPLDLANVAVRVEEPAGTEQTLTLKQVAPGRYEIPYARSSTALAPGAYRLSSALEKGAERLEALAGWSQPYPAEYAGGDANGRLLERIAAAGGGTMLSLAGAPMTFEAPPQRDPVMYWPWFAAVALALWPLEIALRRGWLGQT